MAFSLWLAALASCSIATASTTNQIVIEAAGASFPRSVYEAALYAYSVANGAVRVTYDAVGSGSGRSQILAGTVHWAGTDAPFSIENINARPDIRIFPTVAGAVVPIVNVATTASPSSTTGTDIPAGSGLILSRPTLAKIFAGSITQWDDAAIAADNPHLTLPSTAITVVTRAENSGTTELATQAMSMFDAGFAATVGETSRTDLWPFSLYAGHKNASGNSGMVATVKLTPNSIGYAVLEATASGESQVALMRNRAGRVVEATSTATSFALMELGGSRNSTTGAAVLSDAFSSAAWPIVGYTYVAVSSTAMRGTCEERQATVEFLRWLLTSETVELLAPKLGFAALPGFLRNSVVDELTAWVQCPDGSRAVGSAAAGVLNVGLPSQIAGPWTVLEAAYTASTSSSLTASSTARFSLAPSGEFLFGQDAAATALNEPSTSPTHVHAAVHTMPSKSASEFADAAVSMQAARSDPNLSDLGRQFATDDRLVTVPFSLLTLGVSANLPRVHAAGLSEVRLTTSILVKVFAGTITRWDDAEILAANSHSSALQAALQQESSGITLALPSQDDGLIAAFSWALSRADAAARAHLSANAPSSTIASQVAGQYISVKRWPTSGTVVSVDGAAGVEAALRVVDGAVGVLPAESLHGATVALTVSGSVLRPTAADSSACLPIRRAEVAEAAACWPLAVPLYMSVRRITLATTVRALEEVVTVVHDPVSLAPRDVESFRRALQSTPTQLSDRCQTVRSSLQAATWLLGSDAASSPLIEMQIEPLNGDSARGAQYALSEGARCEGEAVLSLRAQCVVGEQRQSDIACSTCPAGTTNTQAGATCTVCPDEAVCAGGAHFAVTKDYWEGSGRTLYRCNLFACCQSGNCTQTDPQRCANGRIGKLCGWCPDGQSLASQAGGCVNCTDVNWGSVSATVVIQLLLVAYLVFSARDDVKNASVLLVLEFFQLAQLAMNPYREELSFSLELGWLNLRLNPPGSTDCVFPMSPLAFLASPLYVPIFVCFVLGLYTLVAVLSSCLRTCRCDPDPNALWRFQQAGWGTLFVVLAATVQVGLEIMTCRDVEGEWVNASVPAVQCSGFGYYVVAIFSGAAAIGFLIIVPMAVYSSNGYYLVLLSRYKSAFRVLAAIKAVIRLQRRVRARRNLYLASRGLPTLPPAFQDHLKREGVSAAARKEVTSIKLVFPAAWGTAGNSTSSSSSGTTPASPGAVQRQATSHNFRDQMTYALEGAMTTIGLGDLVRPKKRVHYDLESIGWSQLPKVARGNAPLYRPYAGSMAQSFHAFFLLRRSISVVIVTFLVSDPHAKQILLLFWLLFALLVSLATKPFRDFLDNFLNTLSLTVLSLVAALELHYVSFVSDRPERVSFIQLALLIFFVLCVPYAFVSRFLLDRRRAAVEKAVREGTEIPPPSKGCCAKSHYRLISFCRRVCSNNIKGHGIFDDSQYDEEELKDLQRRTLLYARMRERRRLRDEAERMRAAGISSHPAAAAAAAAPAHAVRPADDDDDAKGGHPALAARSVVHDAQRW